VDIFWGVKQPKKLTGCPETSVTKYQSALPIIPVDRKVYFTEKSWNVARKFYLFLTSWLVLGVHPTSFSVSTGILSPGVKGPVCEAARCFQRSISKCWNGQENSLRHCEYYVLCTARIEPQKKLCKFIQKFANTLRFRVTVSILGSKRTRRIQRVCIAAIQDNSCLLRPGLKFVTWCLHEMLDW
jgi:hypothetical protein